MKIPAELLTTTRRLHGAEAPVLHREEGPVSFSVGSALDELERIGGGLSAADDRARALFLEPGSTGFSPRTGGASRVGRARRYDLDIPPSVLNAIRVASRETGVEERILLIYAYIESGFDPSARNGRFAGLFQMSQEEFARHGGRGSRTSPDQNALAAARGIREKQRTRGFPTDASPREQALYLYLMHQQGNAGARAHYSNPERVAWQNLRRFYRSERIARSAVTGNVSQSYLNERGPDMTSGEFIAFWRQRLEDVDTQLGGSPVG